MVLAQGGKHACDTRVEHGCDARVEHGCDARVEHGYSTRDEHGCTIMVWNYIRYIPFSYL